jgi:A/G-specific adenine glycosylase
VSDPSPEANRRPALDAAAIAAALLAWGAANGRSLPGRESRDPWRVLVLEVMSQQTQIERALTAAGAFCARFPTPGELATASTADLLRAWDGLGYNRRALALRAAARAMVANNGGRVPGDAAALLGLPGIGPYTARAVLARTVGQPVMPLDVNVRRVLGRVLQDGSPASLERLGDRIAAAAAEPPEPDDRHRPPAHRVAEGDRAALRMGAPAKRPGPRAATRAGTARKHATATPGPGRVADALMDLAATVCRPRNPGCPACPLATWCAWHREHPDGDPRERQPNTLQSTRRPPFRLTRRWLRGQLLRELRAAPTGQWTRLDGSRGAHDAPAVQETLATLAREGFIDLDSAGRARLTER